MHSLDVLISGAGIAGPTLAYWLVRRGFRPTIVERAPALRTGGYMIDFWGVGYDVAERMALLPTLERVGYRLEELRMVDARGRRIGGFRTGVFDGATNGRFVSLARGDLAREIYALLHGEVETLFGDSILALTETGDGLVASFERAAPRRFDVVIGADGLHSNVRHLVFGDASRFERFLGYYTAAFSVHGYPHRDEGVYVSFTEPGRQLARYALRDGRSAFFFIVAHEPMPSLDHHDTAAQQALLRRVFAGAGWECDEVLRVMERSDDFYFDAVAQVRMPTWHRGRVALLGDAAYCPSLLAGQGSAFGMAGAYVLAHELSRNPRDPASAFAEYERAFKPFVDDKQVAAERFATWFAPRTPLRLRLRNAMTNAMNLPFVGPLIASRSFGDRFVLP